MQAVHDGETALVSVNCSPQTAALYGKLSWSFDPDYMTGRVAVAENRMSATVSNLDGDWYPSVTLHANHGDSVSSSAIVYFCGGMPTNNVVYSPGHTNVTITPVFRSCGHSFHDVEDDPKISMEIEVGRDSASGWQHLAWVDTDPLTPGVQRRSAISRDNPPSLNWDMKAGTAQPLSNGTDSLVYDSLTTFTRALPAVAAGQYVPPPFAKIITRTFDDKDNLIGEFASMLPIPQYVQITWAANVFEEFRLPITFDLSGEAGDIPPPTNVTIFAGCSAQEAATAFAGIASKVQALFPSDANIVVVGPDANVPQPHKTIVIQTGQYVDPVFGPDDRILGIAPNEHCRQRNDSPLGTAYVFDGSIRDSLPEAFGDFYIQSDHNIERQNDWRNVPLPFSAGLLTDYLAQVALHECCHTMGIVPPASAIPGRHNNCDCGSHFMDDGSTKTPLMRLGFITYFVPGWMLSNERYLKFVFAQTP